MDFTRPAIPAPASKCPMLDFTEPMYKGSLGFLVFPKTAPIADASNGSPAGVPGPCASKNPVWAGLNPAFVYAALIKAS